MMRLFALLLTGVRERERVCRYRTGVFLECLASLFQPQQLKMGRRVARQPAMMQMLGSRMDQLATLLCFVSI